MKARIISIILLLALVFTSCGTQKAAVTSSSPAVQTTFFKAKFGDSDEFNVQQTMSEKGGLSYFRWRKVENGNWVYENMTHFAGKDWNHTLIGFTEKRFSRITFVWASESKEEVLDRFTVIYELLAKKYPLHKETLNGKYDNLYTYLDSKGNIVTVCFDFIPKSQNWVCGLMYMWGDATKYGIEKALGEI